MPRAHDAPPFATATLACGAFGLAAALPVAPLTAATQALGPAMAVGLCVPLSAALCLSAATYGALALHRGTGRVFARAGLALACLPPLAASLWALLG
jgi:hypothetical protein